jgi:hypothetical protein
MVDAIKKSGEEVFNRRFSQISADFFRNREEDGGCDKEERRREGMRDTRKAER